MAGLDNLEQRVMNMSKELRPLYYQQKLEEVQRGRAENQALIKEVTEKFEKLER